MAEVSAEATGWRANRRESVTLVVCCTALFMTTLDGTILNVALPSVQRSLHASPAGLQWTVDGYTLLRASSLFLCGSIADRFGRRAMFGAGLVMFVLGSIACGLAPNLTTLIIFRCFQGLGSSVLTPSSLAIITNTFTDPRRRAWAVGMWNAATGVSMTAGPLFGGALVQGFGWRSVFLVNLPIGIAAMFGMRSLAESKAPVARAFDLPGQLAIGLGLATLTYALIEGPSIGWHSGEVLALFVASVACWGGFALVQQRSSHPLIALHYLARPALSGAMLLAVFAITVTSGFSFLNTLYLQEVRGYSPLHAGLLTMPTTVAVVVTAPLAGRLTGAKGARPPALIACGAMAVVMALLAGVESLTTALPVLLAIYLVMGIGNGFIHTPITTAAISSMPKSRAAVAGAIGTTGRQIGQSLGVALVGSIVFSVAGPAIAGSSLRAPGAATAFVHGLRVGNLVSLGLALVAAGVACWAFRSNTLHIDFEEDRAGEDTTAATTR
jgi:EmrB/QacA subfamily drug resistance transporter